MKRTALIIAILALSANIVFSQQILFEGKIISTMQVNNGTKTESVDYCKNGNKMCDIGYLKTKTLFKDGISYMIDYSGTRPVVTVLTLSTESKKALNIESYFSYSLEKETVNGHGCIKVIKQSESSTNFFAVKKNSQYWIDTSFALYEPLSPTEKGLVIKSITTMEMGGRKTTTVSEVVSVEACPVAVSLFDLPDTTEALYRYNDDLIKLANNPSDTTLLKKFAETDTGQKTGWKYCIEVDDGTFAKSIKKGITVVDFSAEWCKPCRMLQPVLDTLAYKNQKRARFYTMDIDKSSNTAKKLGIKSVPVVIVFKNGVEVGRIEGYYPDIENQIENLIAEKKKNDKN